VPVSLKTILNEILLYPISTLTYASLTGWVLMHTLNTFAGRQINRH
jgi:hypothetical protein